MIGAPDYTGKKQTERKEIDETRNRYQTPS